jgi:pimeloyl-ACP methyl ester carboxylesterase
MIPEPHQQGLHALPDGRALGWAEYGDPAGAPLLFFHGTPGCRYTAGLMAEAALTAGVRLIGVDRPGLGVSDPAPRRTLRSWPDDVASLADGLGLDRFAVAGWSGGGVHALACGWRIPERLTACIVLAGVASPDTPGQGESLTPFLRAVQVTTLRAPRLSRVWFHLIAWVAPRQKEPSASERRLDPVGSRPDVWAAGQRELREAFKQGVSGAHWDYVLNVQPWGFRPEDVTAHVDLWMGEEDQNVSPGAVRQMVARFPSCEARFVPGAHYLPVTYGADIAGLVAQRAAVR